LRKEYLNLTLRNTSSGNCTERCGRKNWLGWGEAIEHMSSVLSKAERARKT
jgi:hypothetical protein